MTHLTPEEERWAEAQANGLLESLIDGSFVPLPAERTKAVRVCRLVLLKGKLAQAKKNERRARYWEGRIRGVYSSDVGDEIKEQGAELSAAIEELEKKGT